MDKMTIIRSPELGMFISGAMAAVGVYASIKMLQERWDRRNRFNDAQYRASWNKQILPMTAWLVASFVGLAKYIHDYYVQLMHGP
jgi:hypothetical protein